MRLTWPITAACLVAALLAVRSTWESSTAATLNLFAASPRESSISGIDSSRLAFEVSNEYTTQHGPIGSRKLQWTHIAEPHKTTSFSVTLDGEECLDACANAQWVVDGYSYEGPVVSHAFTRYGFHDVRVSVPSTSRGDLEVERASELAGDAHHEDRVMVKWVRRELRTLSESDRERFFSAMHTLWHVRTETGQTLYNSTKYKGAEYFVRKHLFGAASQECDHWHDNAGLMTHHMAFTLELEQSLQAIEPSLSVPYWEYSYDAVRFEHKWSHSEVFGDAWFGEASPSSDAKTVTSGRWAYTPILANARQYSNITNRWGLLRSPWNQNPVPFVTRHNRVLGRESWVTFPSCAEYDEAFRMYSFSDITPYLNGVTHGPVHIMLGGQWHQNTTGVKRFFQSQQTNFLLMAKVLWRHGFLRCEGECVEGVTDLEECVCTCPAEYLDRFDPYDILVTETGIMHWYALYSEGMIYFNETDGRYHIADYTHAQEDAAWASMYEALCNPGWVGELFTSAAPADPIFYVIHTTAERFLWTRLLLSQSDPDRWPFDDTWGYDHTLSTPSDTGEKCHWDGVAGSERLPSCVRETCPGHGEFDIIPFGDFVGDDPVGSYTNKKFWEFMMPNNELLPYTYDNFDYPWCEEAGYNWT